MPDLVVVDASAVIDAAAPGPRFDAFSALQEAFAAQAPELLAWELGSVVYGRRASAFGASVVRRTEALELMLAGIELVPTSAEGRAASGALATKHGLTFYDAAYLELAARDADAILVTQDAGLHQAATKALGVARVATLDEVPRLLARPTDA